ncbi:RHS repeat-associated core domain-containing protein [Brevibacillus formosus]
MAAVWFPYSSPTSNIFHAMPPEGSRAKLYFPTHNEAEAMLTESVRTSFSSSGKAAEKANKKMADSTVKSFSTDGGKEFELGTKEISFTAKEGKLLINIGEKGGITFLSDQDIVMMAEEEMSFTEMKAFRATAEEGMFISGGTSSMILNDTTDVMGPTVTMTGSERQSYEPLSNPEAEQAKSEKERDGFLEKLGTALDVLSMVPGLGIIAGAASAVVSLCRGDLLGAALSIGTMLPIGGAAFGAAKLAAKGAAKLAAKGAAKAGGKLGREAAKKAIQLGKNSMNKVLTGARKLKQQADQMRALMQKKLQEMKQQVVEKSKALTQKALERSGAKKSLTKLNKKVLKKFECTKGLGDRFCKWGFEPVDLITGRMVSEGTDFEFPGQLPLEWTWRWISDSRHQGLLGHGVHHTLDLRLEVLDDCIGVLLADGRAVAFEKLHQGLMKTQNQQEKLTLRREGTGYALVEQDSRLTYYFGQQVGSQDSFRLERIQQEWSHSISLDYDELGYLMQVTDSVGRVLEIETDEFGRMTKVTHVYQLHGSASNRDVLVKYAYNQAGDLIEVTDALGQTKYMFYDKHLMIKKTDRNGYSFHWHYDGPTTGARCVHTYGDDGLLEGRIAYFDGWNEVTNSQGHKTRYEYTPENYCTRIIDPLGGEVEYTYSEQGELVSETDAGGRVTQYVYDASGRIVSEIHPDGSVWTLTYQADGRLKQVTDPEGGSRIWQYDELGRVKKILSAEESVSVFTYDQRHRICEVSNPIGAVTKLSYDEHDNLIQLTLPDGTSATWTYNHRGECLQETNPLGAKQMFVYDALGRVVRTVLPDGNVIKLQYNAYDNVIVAQDAQHHVSFGYTPLGKLTWREEKGKRIELVYNQEEQLTAVVNESSERYVLERDAKGNVVRETGFDGVERRYIRDVSGRLEKVERPDGRWTGYSYDEMGRVTKVAYSDGLVETFRFNRIGDPIEAINPFAQVKWEYDRSGRVIKEWRDQYWVASEYDELGNRIKLNSSLGAHISMERDLVGQVSQIRAEHVGDKTVPTKPWMAQMTYNALGQELTRLLPGGVSSDWDFDDAGRPVHHRVKAGGRENRRRRYHWDINNRLKSMVSELTDTKTQFVYNDFGTLIGSTNSYSKIFRMADEVGNLYSSGLKTDRVYGAGGRLLEFNGIRYHYDNEGNLTEKNLPDGTQWRYEYYGNGMISKVVRPDGKEVTFSYDPLGRRIQKQYDGVTTNFVWDTNNILHEWKENPQVCTTWVFEEGTFQPAAKITPEGSYSIIHDHLGTPVEMYNQTGERIWACELDMYGKSKPTELLGEPSSCPFRFQGQYEDEETGLYYNRFRYYSPHEGMYTQQDPIKLNGGMALYGYVHDPNAWVDPFGLKKGNKGKGETKKEYKLSDHHGFPREVLWEYDEIKLGRGTPRIHDHRSPPHLQGLQKTYEARKAPVPKNSIWYGALEFGVPNTNHRILKRRDGKLGYAAFHGYDHPKLFPGPWFQEGGTYSKNDFNPKNCGR